MLLDTDHELVMSIEGSVLKYGLTSFRVLLNAQSGCERILHSMSCASTFSKAISYFINSHYSSYLSAQIEQENIL